MVADLSSILDQIESALRRPAAGGGDAVARVEKTLTDGYARALQVEGELLRLERRISELARDMGRGDGERNADELAELSRRVARAESDLRHLRGRLAELRQHAEALRAA